MSRTVHTIGHSNHEVTDFLDLLAAHGIELLVDVRSSPYSRYATQYNREQLDRTLVASGVNYLFLGDRLGGRPDGDEFYDDDGHVRYWRVAESDWFLEGIRQLEGLADQACVATMCSEEDPNTCHRRLLVGRVLDERGVAVVHIRGDGALQTEAELKEEDRRRQPSHRQLSLFAEPEINPWRSTHSVLQRNGPQGSSRS